MEWIECFTLYNLLCFFCPLISGSSSPQYLGRGAWPHGECGSTSL